MSHLRSTALQPTALRIRTPAGFRLAIVTAIVATIVAANTWSQNSNWQEPASAKEFHFVRLAYSDIMGGGGAPNRRGRWTTDIPDAEGHLLEGVERLTRINTDRDPTYMAIMDERLFDYPWLYAVEVGYWMLSEEEAARLRDYLLRGGMLVVDDFHGTQEWSVFVRSMQRVFPDRPIVDIPPDDAIFHIAWDVTDRVQIPGIQMLYSGRTYEKDGYDPHWRGIYDDHGRLMVIINFNMDLGDAWEHADVPEYALQYTLLAYKYTINYVLYAMTH
jgi:hypothetical protein